MVEEITNTIECSGEFQKYILVLPKQKNIDSVLSIFTPKFFSNILNDALICKEEIREALLTAYTYKIPTYDTNVIIFNFPRNQPDDILKYFQTKLEGRTDINFTDSSILSFDDLYLGL